MFEEYASQEEVFQNTLLSVPSQLLEGYNCTVIAYGQTGTGKTHTMCGLNGGSFIALSKKSQEDPAEDDGQDSEANPEAEGMILKTTRAVFDTIQKSSPSIEYTVRCSYVEIYLEKVLDLLNPQSDVLSIEDDFADEAAGDAASLTGGVRVAGAAELCCFDESDVCGLLARGNACRTMSSTEMNTDSSRSHAIFIMKIEQKERTSGKVTKSVLHMVDLAGSEMAASQNSAAQRSPSGGSAVQVEAKMVNKSLSALGNIVRAQLENQRGAKHSVAALSRQSKLTRLLRPSFGGNCKTTVILTASPSSYNIGETISTIRFGQRARRIENQAVVNVDFDREVYRKRLRESEKKHKDQMALMRALASECQKLKTEARKGAVGEQNHSGPVWETIGELLEGGDDIDLDFTVVVRQRATSSDDDESVDSDGMVIRKEIRSSGGEIGEDLEEARRQIKALRAQLDATSKDKESTENLLAELQSEIAVLRTQNESLIADKTKDLQELIDAKNELQIVSQRKLEVEHNFRTSQFRENEAIVFLRQFRRFYKNVLRDKAAHGSGSMNKITKEISEKIPDTLDLDELVDLDTLLLESGLIEEHELHSDKAAAIYIPSKTALIRSATAAKKASREAEVVDKELSKTTNDVDTAATINTAAIAAQNAPGKDAKPPVAKQASSAIRRASYASDMAESAANEIAQDRSESDSPEPSNEAETGEHGAGADAGAGSSPRLSISEPVPVWDHESGMSITRRHQQLSTPAGRFVTSHEKTMEQQLREMADKCIELELALKEEKATVEILSGKPGGLTKKTFAKEAIFLRQQVAQKTENLMAIAWKMNELNLINKSYNEKMKARDQHVMYLEENYVELQNSSKRTLLGRQEAERKHLDELENLKKVLAGMCVPLWQFRENGKEDRSLVSRIIIPVSGGSHSDMPPPKRKLSEAESEASLELLQEGAVSTQGKGTVVAIDTSTQTDEERLQEMDQKADDPIINREDAEVQTDEEPRVEKEDAEVQTEEEWVGTDEAGGAIPVKLSIETVESGVQTDDGDLSEPELSVVKAVDGTCSACGSVMGNKTGATAAPAVDDDGSVEQKPDEGKEYANMFASTVFSVLGRAHVMKKVESKTPPKAVVEKANAEDQAALSTDRAVTEEEKDGGWPSSREAWSAARDDFDFIVQDSTLAVSSTKRGTKSDFPPGTPPESPEKSAEEFLMKARAIGHKQEEEGAIVTMGSKKVLFDEPDETAHVVVKKHPWKKTEEDEQTNDDSRDFHDSNTSSGASFDPMADDWYGSDGELSGSMILEKNSAFRVPRPQSSRAAAENSKTITNDSRGNERNALSGRTARTAAFLDFAAKEKEKQEQAGAEAKRQDQPKPKALKNSISTGRTTRTAAFLDFAAKEKEKQEKAEAEAKRQAAAEPEAQKKNVPSGRSARTAAFLDFAAKEDAKQKQAEAEAQKEKQAEAEAQKKNAPRGRTTRTAAFLDFAAKEDANQQQAEAKQEEPTSQMANGASRTGNPMFTGGRHNEFIPRRLAEKQNTKIRAGVMKEGKKPPRDADPLKRRSDLTRRKSEHRVSRRHVTEEEDEDSKKKKKKKSESKKSESRKSESKKRRSSLERHMSRSKSERHPQKSSKERSKSRRSLPEV